jgi:hypothetical protein
MGKGFPVAPRGTEPPPSAWAGAGLDVKRRHRDTGPALRAPVDHAQPAARVESAHAVFPLLGRHVGLAGRGHLGEELGRRDLFGLDPGGGRDFALGHPQGVIHDPRRIDLHGHGVGIGGVDAVQIQDFLEIEVHALNAPTVGIEGERLGGRQPRGRQDIGQQFVARATAAPPDIAHELGRRRGSRAGPDQPVLQAPAAVAALAQPLQPVQAHEPVAPKQPPTALRLQRVEEVDGTVEPIAEQQRVAGHRPQHPLGAGHFAGGGIGREVQLPAQPAAQVVDAQQAAGQHHRALAPEQLQPMGDGGQARAVEQQDVGEAGTHRGHARGITRGHRLHQAGGEAAEHLREEGRPQIPAALKERLGSRHDAREHRLPLVDRVDQGLAQRFGRAQDHGRPEFHEGLQGPRALPLGPAHAPKDGLTQGARDVRLQQIHHADQIDPRCRRRRTLAHRTSRAWGFHEPVHATTCESRAFYLSGDDIKSF